MLVDVGDLPVQEIRDCGVDDKRLMEVVSDSVKSIMEEVSVKCLFLSFYFNPNIHVLYVYCVAGMIMNQATFLPFHFLTKQKLKIYEIS